MKKVFFIWLSLFLLSCSKNDNKVWNPNTPISLRPEIGVKSEAEIPTAKEVVEKTSELRYWHSSLPFPRGYAFYEGQRDLVNNRLVMRSFEVIDPLHGLVPFFIEATDMVFIRIENDVITDTLAYIPNATLRAAEAIMKKAYAEEDYETCYQTFDNAFRFIPITGAKWRELKEQGKQ